jgi:methylenetetrahydrofolate dehydrogenase (NADP+)/methenyltetrahydrofolate cyclohydrolase
LLPQGASSTPVRIEGVGRDSIQGDVRFAEVEPIASAISPVPGGVGPMTVTLLLVNTVASWWSRTGGAAAANPLGDLLP